MSALKQTPEAKPRTLGTAALLIVAAVVMAFSNGLTGAFVFDDIYAIVENPTIRSLGQLDRTLAPGSEGGTVGGRPIVNLSLAFNHAMSGVAPWSYHVFNVVVHAAAALALFGIARRTWQRLPGGRSADAPVLAAVIAGVWALHPLQTESVTYVVQRAESLAGLFLFLTLYCFIRSVDAVRPLRWRIASVLACLVGVGCKEILVAAPLLVALYDRAFIAPSWRGVFAARGWFHGTLVLTWIPLAGLVIATEGRGGSAGFSTAVSSWEYALTQCHAIPHYLRLTLWPEPLVFDYGTSVVRNIGAVAVGGLVVIVLLATTLWAIVKKPRVGFLGAVFFAALAPSSSFIPVATQTMAEHRMYVSLAAVVALVVAGSYRLWGRGALVFLAFVGIALGGATAARNLDYRSELSIWHDTVAKRPGNARAHTNLGLALAEAGRLEPAVAHYEAALRSEPENESTRLNLCAALTRLGRAAEAVTHGEAAVRISPASADARVNLGHALTASGRPQEAVGQFAAALEKQPDALDARLGLADALTAAGSLDAAAAHYRAVLESDPLNVTAWCGLAGSLAGSDPGAARDAVQAALRIHPASPAALYIQGNLLAADGRFVDAIEAYRQVLVVDPRHIPAGRNLGNALLMAGRVDQAIEQYRRVLALRPNDTGTQENLQRALEYQQSAALRR